MPLLFGDFFKFVLEFLLFFTSGFMILLVLVQRGRGGGLTGALGGMGGQSAFGAKAGDVFTRITVFSAIIWIFLCLITIMSYTYVQVDTTAMKEYEYKKLLVDDGESIGEDSAPETTGTGDADIDSGKSSMTSTDEDEKKSDDDDQTPVETKQDGDTKKDGETKKDEESSKEDGKSVEPTKSDDETKKTEDKDAGVNEKSSEEKSGEPKTESKEGEKGK